MESISTNEYIYTNTITNTNTNTITNTNTNTNINTCTVCCISLENPMQRLKCGKCLKRIYCSKDCQIIDWKFRGHKHWCCLAGEIGFDYEIKQSDKFKGLGVFAMRDFTEGEKIMAQKPFVIEDLPLLTINQIIQIQKLEPSNSDLIADKFDLNALNCGKGLNPVLCLHASRINHQCPFVENCSHLWIKEHGVKIIYAKKNIKIGEELTISYIDSFDSYAELSDKWGFQCGCDGCSNPHNMVYQKELVKLNQFIFNSQIDPKIRIEACVKLIDLYSRANEYSNANIPLMMYMRTYWDLYNLSMEINNYDEAKKCLEKCIEMEYKIVEFESANLKMLKQRLGLFQKIK